MKAVVFWDIRLSFVVNVYQHFGTMYLSHLQGSGVQKEKKASTPKNSYIWEGVGGDWESVSVMTANGFATSVKEGWRKTALRSLRVPRSATIAVHFNLYVSH